MKKSEGDRIAQREEGWIDIDDELPKKRRAVWWLRADGNLHFAALELSHKDFLKKTCFSARYWRKDMPESIKKISVKIKKGKEKCKKKKT